MSINCDEICGNGAAPNPKKSFWQYLFPATITKLVVRDVIVGVATTSAGPDTVDVEVFLSQTLGSVPPSILDDNVLLRSLVHMSLGAKPVGNDKGDNVNVLKIYLEKLQNNVVPADLMLCASLLKSDSLQLPNGKYFQISKITF
jgi:hypothetical protein